MSQAVFYRSEGFERTTYTALEGPDLRSFYGDSTIFAFPIIKSLCSRRNTHSHEKGDGDSMLARVYVLIRFQPGI